MKVWIDQDLCTGAALCEDLAPDVFVMGSDGLAYVHEQGRILGTGDAAIAAVPTQHAERVLDAIEACPAECIYIEVD